MTSWWWPVDQISFTRAQVFWLLEYLYLIEEGRWPPEPDEYKTTHWGVETIGHRGASIDLREIQKSKYMEPKAYFEKPLQVTAELKWRLEQAGTDGVMCKMFYQYGEDLSSISRHFKIDRETALRRIERALRYIKGWRRKKEYQQRGS